MTDHTPDTGYRDRLVDEVTSKVTHRRAVEEDTDLVRAKAEEAVDGLIDAPVQSFVPLLAENQVVSELKRDPGPAPRS